MNITQLSKMSIDELKALNEMVVHILRTKARDRVSDIQIGDTVKINHSSVIGRKFKVVKINRKKMRVKDVNGTSTYNVSFNLIEKI